MRLAQGHDAEIVMQETSQRIVNKLQHPVILAIQETVTSKYDSSQSLEEYKKNYLARVGFKADHIKDN